MSELVAYQKAYDFMLWVFQKTDAFPKSKRFTIGQRLENALLDLVTGLYMVQYSSKSKKEILHISEIFDNVKLLLKISYDARLIGHKSFSHAVKQSDEIGAMMFHSRSYMNYPSSCNFSVTRWKPYLPSSSRK